MPYSFLVLYIIIYISQNEGISEYVWMNKDNFALLDEEGLKTNAIFCSKILIHIGGICGILPSFVSHINK